jgi:hypothetical protein
MSHENVAPQCLPKNMLSAHTHAIRLHKRKGGDSNPRDGGCPSNGFQDRRIQPLCHPSEGFCQARKPTSFLAGFQQGISCLSEASSKDTAASGRGPGFGADPAGRSPVASIGVLPEARGRELPSK